MFLSSIIYDIQKNVYKNLPCTDFISLYHLERKMQRWNSEANILFLNTTRFWAKAEKDRLCKANIFIVIYILESLVNGFIENDNKIFL